MDGQWYLFHSLVLLQSSVWSQETGLSVPLLLLLSSLHHTRTCACPPCSHTHTPALGTLGYRWAGALWRIIPARKNSVLPPHRPVGGTLGSRPRKGSTASWFMLRWERLAQEQWRFRKTPLCSGETRRGFPSGPSLVPLPQPANHNSHMAFSGTSLSSERFGRAQH